MYILGTYGFGEKWCKWMKHSITTIRFSVLVNGTLVVFFKSSQGLKQGNSLSTFLFVLVMDALSRLLKVAMERGFISGFLVGCSLNGCINVSYLLFADDTLILCELSLNQFQLLKGEFVCA